MGPGPGAGKLGVYQGHGSPGKGLSGAHLGPGGLATRTLLPLVCLLFASLLLNTMWVLYARPQPQPLDLGALGTQVQGQWQGQGQGQGQPCSGQPYGMPVPCPCANSTSLLSTQEEPPTRKRPKVNSGACFRAALGRTRTLALGVLVPAPRVYCIATLAWGVLLLTPRAGWRPDRGVCYLSIGQMVSFPVPNSFFLLSPLTTQALRCAPMALSLCLFFSFCSLAAAHDDQGGAVHHEDAGGCEASPGQRGPDHKHEL